MITMNDDAVEEEGSSKETTVIEIIKRFLERLPEVLRRSDASKAVKERGNDGMISI